MMRDKDCQRKYVPWLCGFCPELRRCGYLRGGKTVDYAGRTATRGRGSRWR